MSVQVIKMRDKDDTEVRLIGYRGYEIRIDTWRTRGYRLPMKSAEVRHWDGWTKSIWCKSPDDRKFSLWKTNADLIREGKELIRERITQCGSG